MAREGKNVMRRNNYPEGKNAEEESRGRPST